MNLIPEYDPAVYGSSMTLQRVSTNASSTSASDDDAVDLQEEHQNDTRTENKDHYSSSYLDTYSTLMDIPQTFLHREMEDEAAEQETNKFEVNEVEEAMEEPQITVISAVSQHKSTPAMLGNINSNDTEERDGKEQDSDRDRDRDQRDRSHSDPHRGNEDGSGDDDDDEDHDDGDEREEHRQNVMDNIVERLNAMEQRMDTQFQTINARLTILEGKVKFIESQKVRSATTTQSKGESSSVPPPSASSEMKRPRPDTEDNHTFAESTIGSSSLPISLTPAPRSSALRDRTGAFRNNNKLNATTFPMQSTLTSQTVNRPISASVQRPKHIHAPTARSPFLGNASSGISGTSAISGYSGYTLSDRSGSGLSNGYRGDVMCDVMRYPLSSSSSIGMGNGSNLKLTERVPRIQSVQMPSNSADDRKEPSGTVSTGGGTEDEADNTLNFIEELRDMLKSTDKLLRAKPMDLYDSNM